MVVYGEFAMIRVLLFLLGSMLCLGIAVLPELAMWMLYGIIHPETEVARLIVLIAFWLGGSGVCIGFAMLAFALECAVLQAVLE